MSEHPTASEFEEYRRGAAAPARLLALDDHLAACAPCRARAATDARADDLLAGLRADLRAAVGEVDAHADYEELSAYADGTLDAVGREALENHLLACADCGREARELREFAAAAAPQLTREYLPSAEAARAPGGRPRRRNVFAAFRPAGWSPAWAAVAAALMLAVAATLWIALREGEGGQAEIARMTPAPRTPAPSPSAPATPEVGGGTEDGSAAASPTPGAAKAEAVVALKDAGGGVSLDAAGRLSGLGTITPAQAEAIKYALETGRAADDSALADLGARPGVLMGAGAGGESFALRGPSSVVVVSTRPTLRWDALEGAGAYRVTVYDADFNAVASSPDLKVNSWAVAPALGRGGVYSWQVTALKDGREIKAPKPPAPEAKFRVLDSARASELERLRRTRSHLALGVFYARAGLLADAEREFAALSRRNPHSAPARRLLADVRAAAGRRK